MDNKFRISKTSTRSDRKGKEIDFIYDNGENYEQEKKQDQAEYRQDSKSVIYAEG